RDEVRVERRHEQLVAEDAEAVVDEAATGCKPLWQFATVAPDLLARARIECPCQILRTGDVEDVVADERRRFEVSERRRLERPLRLKLGYVFRSDLVQRAVAMVGVVPAKGQPARAVGLEAVDDFLNRHLRWRRRLLRDRDDAERRHQQRDATETS